MKGLRSNLFTQYSVVSFVIVIGMAFSVAVVLSNGSNHTAELLKAHGAAMMSGTLKPADPFSIPNITTGLQTLRSEVLALMGVGFAIFYGSLLSIVWRGWRTITRQQAALSRANEDLQEANQERENLLITEREQLRLAETLGRVALAMSATLDLSELLDLICRESRHVFASGAAYIWLLQGDELVGFAGYGEGREQFIGKRISRSDPITLGARVVREMEPIFVNDAADSTDTNPQLTRQFQIKSILGVPLIKGSQAIGALMILETQKRQRFGPEDRETAMVLGSHAAVAIDNARSYEQLGQETIERERAEQEIRKLNLELEQRVLRRTQELEAANRELESFSYSVSHDLRAPLRAMDGFSRIVIEDYSAKLPEEGRGYLERVRDNAKHMGQLVDDLLAFSRLGRAELRKQALAPADLVRQVLTELTTDEKNGHAEISIGELPEIHGDPALLKQVYFNLLSNALKFTSKRDGARIEVGFERDHGEGAYFVKDNGAGFEMAYAEKLFGVFQRLHSPGDFEGTGVGLAIVQRVIQRHGGRVWAEAEVDQGATFFFTLGGNSDHD